MPLGIYVTKKPKLFLKKKKKKKKKMPAIVSITWLSAKYLSTSVQPGIYLIHTRKILGLFTNTPQQLRRSCASTGRCYIRLPGSRPRTVGLFHLTYVVVLPEFSIFPDDFCTKMKQFQNGWGKCSTNKNFCIILC